MINDMSMSKRGRYLAALAAVICLAQSACADTPPAAVDPAALEVAGVRLNMTVDEATAALRQFDAAYSIERRYADSDKGFGYYGLPIDRFRDKDTAYLVGLLAKKDDSGDHEEVFVYVSPLPDKERVIFVGRAKQFAEPQLATAIAEGLFAKYPKDTTADRPASSSRARRIIWRFDGRGRVMSAATAEQEGIDEGIEYIEYRPPATPQFRSLADAALNAGTGGGLSPGYDLLPPFPARVSGNQGVSLDAAIGSPGDNLALGRGFALALYRGSELVRFNEQAKATYAEKERRRDAARQQQEIEKAKSANGPATKF